MNFIQYALKLVSFKAILTSLKNKLLSLDGIAGAAKWVTKLIVDFTENEHDDIIYAIVEPEVDSIVDYINNNESDAVSDKIKFAGERLQALGKSLIEKADSFN